MNTEMDRARILDNYDYAAWQCPRYVWASVDTFLKAPVYDEGIHSIDCGGLPLDLLFYGAPLDCPCGAVVPVFFSGAVTARLGKRAPFFSGLGIAKAHSLPAICVADPSLVLDPALGLAWYAGNARQPVQAALATVLEGLAARSGSELLLIGGSGGGFAALYYGYTLGCRASVLAWNPQTDWLEYQEAAVRQYLAVAYPDLPLPATEGLGFRQAASIAIQALGVTHSLLPIAKAAVSVPRRLVYVQNASDWHVARHAAPFMEAIGCHDADDGFYPSSTPEGMVWFGNWGKGHEAAPRELIDFILQRMLDPGMRPAGLAAELRAGDMAVYIDPEAAPRDMRRAVFNTRVEAATTGEMLHARVCLDPAPAGHAQLNYAFYVYSGQERIATRWYEPDSSYALAEVSGKPATKVLAFVRDGFGRQLSIQETKAIAKATERPWQRSEPAMRVHIYGSCVSRDAFELVEHDFVLAGYIARSSLASAFDARLPPPEVSAGIGKIESAFQRRMVEWDTSRRAGGLLLDTPSEVVLLDLVDERFSLLNADGALVTLSVEFSRTGYPADPERVIASGSPAHMKAWELGLKALLSVVDPEHLIVNRVRWASKDDQGKLLPGQELIARNNMNLTAMYDILAAVPGVRFIDYPDDLLVADRHHKWGISPFHYTRAMSAHMVRSLRELLVSGSDRT